MKLKSLLKGVLLVAVSSLLIVAVSFLGLFAFVYYNSSGGRDWGTSVSEISRALVRNGTAYTFTGEELLEEGQWLMLLDADGHISWSLYKPGDLPEQYGIADVASFSRWYLGDYPVKCWIRDDGLLVLGSPKGSVWKHDIAMNTRYLLQAPIWFLAFFLLALGSVLGLAWLVLGRWFRQAQHIRDSARSEWINGVSHDIRTPLSMVMGYAAQLEEAPGLNPKYKSQAAAIRVQSQVIRELVNDLNLTMRLDCQMQALRKETLRPEVFLRRAAADFLNGGMAEGFDFNMDLPEDPLPPVEADPFLLRRAVSNLLINAVKHNGPGGYIRLGAGVEDGMLVFWVEGGTAAEAAGRPGPQVLEPDGGAAHGTGLKLVTQIAAAHGGRADFYRGTPWRCRLILPLKVAPGKSQRHGH